MVKRIATFGLVLLAVGGCSRLQLGSTAYSSLPSVALPGAGTSFVANPAAPLGRNAALTPVVIPGTLLTPQANNGQRGVDPTAMLEAPAHAHSLTKPVHSLDHSKSTAPASRPHKLIDRDVTETGATSAWGGSTTSRQDPAPSDAQNYNREAAMDRLVNGGKDAARAICSGC